MNIDRATAAQTLLKHRKSQSGPPVRSSELVSLRGWIVGWRRVAMKYFMANPMPGNWRVAYANEREEKAMQRLAREKQANSVIGTNPPAKG